MVIVASVLVIVGGCSGDPAPREVIVSPGTTVFEEDDDVRPGDTIICRASDGEAGALVPEPGTGVGNSAGLDIAVEADGRIVVRCARTIAQA
jgi:hypothetical protein